MNSVCNILGKNLDHELRMKVKELGAPKPDLNINQEQKQCKARQGYTRNFNRSMYNAAEWLCGCDVKNAFFCFTCIVTNSSDSSWTETGITDLKNFHAKVKKHNSCEKHLNGFIEFSMLGKVDIMCQLDSAYRRNINTYNENVSKNRYILGKLIDCIKFCGKFELALRGHDETENSNNPGIFRGLVDLMSELDSVLKQHIDKSKNRVFLGLSKTIQNELLESIYEVCLNLIKSELSQTNYLAIEVDETTDCATLSQLVLIIRYELLGKINERFISFVQPKSHTADDVTVAVLSELEKMKVSETPEKMIAQCYDGAPVMSGHKSGVQVKIKEVYKNAHFIHCYAHQLNLIVERCVTGNKQVRIFFSNLEGISTFFSQSPKRTAVLDEIVKKRIPTCPQSIRWNFKSRSVTTLYKYQKEIVECVEKIIDDESNDYKTINKAMGLKGFLQNEDFLFWLYFFNKVMPHCDILFNELQQKSIDAVKTIHYVSQFAAAIQTVRDSLDTDERREQEEPTAKRRRFTDTRKMCALDVCDRIMIQVSDRFSFSDHLSVAQLFEPQLFCKYQSVFPEKELKVAVNLFQLQSSELRHELNVLYSRKDFMKASGALTLLNFLYDNNLAKAFPESVKLLQIIVTFPMTTGEAERCFSMLKRVKTFMRNTMNEDRLCALAMCSLEKDLLNRPNFNEMVIDHFAAQKGRRADFIYKQMN